MGLKRDINNSESYGVNYIKTENLITKEQIKDFRLKLDMSQEVFANILGVSSNIVKKIELGTLKPTKSLGKLIYLLLQENTLVNSLCNILHKKENETNIDKEYYVSENVYFENAKKERRIIGIAKSKNEVFDLIEKFLEKYNYKSYYSRIWEKNDEYVIDVGSHSEFFMVSKRIKLIDNNYKE